MSLPLDHTLILNRAALDALHQAGLNDLAVELNDINAARKLALWRRSSGTDLYLLALMTAASRQVALRYFGEANLKPANDRVLLAGQAHLLPELGSAYRDFLDCYPREALHPARQPGATAAAGLSRLRLLAEIHVLEVLVENPATQDFQDLYDDTDLRARFDYHALIERLTRLTGTPQGPLVQGQSLPALLRAPLRAAPHSLAGQVAYIAQHWAAWLPEQILSALQLARAITGEEDRVHLPGPGPSPTPLFGKGDGSETPASFTADLDWMASCVLLAKSIHVWLDQLSIRYRRAITTLAEIPDEELAGLARQGFNALWLIGIWERSVASKRIKQMSGNPEAEASAYALHAYRVAADLGGESALHELEQRCQQHGIRLACDVVPNHTGIDSEWVREHPEWFLQVELPPYPGYAFSGPDLCDAEEISIRIEDGYWDHSDAAVVYELIEHHSGRRRYIYHGNDGTHMPWNDTAQLNFLLPEVRQAMSDLILAVARRFRLIRFDAAMTLARKHFRRLWFPPPGGSAGVPSRSVCWMSDADFDQVFPVEFWREVVDRINREAPNTLLIAEAFWLMESYFVRNLGMHRVYNSAFMNMLKREENAKYRKILRDILAFNPEILKRYVNFMNNPDEATAVEQFEKGDKYFGVATLLATLPGLPMFGHGQIEGYREKYGMEYRRAYWQEEPDAGFVAHHERQIFPLLRIRQQFAGVDHFSLYDFVSAHGIDENVYAFSNGPPGGKLLVVYNNAAQPTAGRLHQAAPKAAPEQEGAAHPMPPLWQELGLDPARGGFCRFRSMRGVDYLQAVDELRHGMTLQLDAYEHQVFLDFRLLDDADGLWQQLHGRLRGRAVTDLDREMLQMRYQPLWRLFNALFDPGRLHVLAGAVLATPQPAPVRRLIAQLNDELQDFAAALHSATGATAPHPSGTLDLERLLTGLTEWLTVQATGKLPCSLLTEAWNGTRRQPGLGAPILSWVLLQGLGKLLGVDGGIHCLQYLRQFGLDHAWQLSAASIDQERDRLLAMTLLETTDLSPHPSSSESAFASLCRASANAGLLGINTHAGTTWFVEEGMATLAGAVALQAGIIPLIHQRAEVYAKAPATAIAEVLRQRLARAAAVGYRLDKFLRLG
jgi:glycosidase